MIFKEDDINERTFGIGKMLDSIGHEDGMLDSLDYKGGIRPQDIPDLFGRMTNSSYGQFNCYPGIPGSGCFKEALFVSLKSPRYAKGRGHLTFKQAIEKLIQHMQGSCANITEIAILVTDNWDPKVFAEWKTTLLNIKKNKDIKIYLIIEKNEFRIDL